VSLGDVYTLGVRLTGDITSLRAELAAGNKVVSDFAQASTAAMNRAAEAMDRAATAMTSAGNRAAKATETPLGSTRRTASGFEDYMRRATKAQEEVARSSEQTSQRTTRSLDGIGATLSRLTGYAGLALLVRQVGQVGLGFHEFTQNTEVALTTLLGAREEAKGFLADILAFAKQTPYAFTDLTSEAQKLLSYGFQTEQIIPILRATGDAATAMGKGTEGIERLNRALGQIQAAGKLRSQELLQMSEVGVNGLAILANQAGVTTGEFQDMVTKGLVPADVAVQGLVKGIREGTDGINGQTAAFGGLMEQIKGSGGVTATTDSARTAFRNMSAELTDSLTPAYLGFLRLATQGMNQVRGMAGVFNDLPAPVQTAAIAFAATAVAVRLLNVEARATGAWRTFQGTLAASRANAELLGYRVTGLRTAMIATRAVASSVGTALLGAFGGPVGLAIAGVTAAISAFAAQSATAKAAAQSYAEAVKLIGDEADLAVERVAKQNFITGENVDWGWFQKWQTGYESVADAIEGMGLSLDEAAKVVAGSEDDFDAYITMLEEMRDAAQGSDLETFEEIRVKLLQQREALQRQRHVQEQLNRAEATGVEVAMAQGRAYTQATVALRTFSDEQMEALDKASEAARKAANLNVGGRDLNLASEQDVAKAREDVEQATRRLRDAEDDRAALAERDKVTARDRRRADEAVADARKALQEATENLTATEARTDPVAQYRKTVEEMISTTQTFVQDIQTLASQGLNAIDLQEIINAGPEGSADIRKALLGDPSMVDFANEARDTIQALLGELDAQGRIAQTGLTDVGDNWGGTIGLAMRISLQGGAYDTVTALAEALGEDPQRVYDIGMRYGLAFLQGMSDAAQFQKTMTITPEGGFRFGRNTPAAFAAGGIFHGVMPGYTPGRDTHLIAVGGGEAIMRPEFTRAVGADFIHRMNALARTGGIDAVRRAMGSYLGAFATGGVAGAPSVVQVPVTTTIERHAPFHAENVYIGTLSDAERENLRRRADANLIGRRF
jgi:tape measure domain-containing protein